MGRTDAWREACPEGSVTSMVVGSSPVLGIFFTTQLCRNRGVKLRQETVDVRPKRHPRRIGIMERQFYGTLAADRTRAKTTQQMLRIIGAIPAVALSGLVFFRPRHRGVLLCLTFKLSDELRWRGVCCSEHNP